ncbi:DUF2177 family protein [Sphaerotilus uruguayifluvii]|uniref:Membrane protein n=1 Tax=Sphaerotilus uruguayifluvii TaxID=2735897 RepID=A0ABX2G0M4_9BURK|nr:DUF2177 family protein [Leptothrix sp. C29]NRT55843.1 putative membrane protein [Leptothrix sp. C29]
MLWLKGWGAALLAVGLLDALWLGWIARGFYVREMGDLMAAQVRTLPALLFYVGYPAGVAALVLWPRPEALPEAVLRAALVGLLVYGTYDLTNMATLRHWSLRLALVDVAWGTLVSAAAGAAAHLATRPAA